MQPQALAFKPFPVGKCLRARVPELNKIVHIPESRFHTPFYTRRVAL